VTMIYKPEPERINGQFNNVHPDINMHMRNVFGRIETEVYRKIEYPYAMSLSMELRVLWYLRRHGGMRMSQIERVFYLGYLRREGEITPRTAVKRLLKAGEITAKWHERGWFRYYTYHIHPAKSRAV
jgi:hypothetical protein